MARGRLVTILVLFAFTVTAKEAFAKHGHPSGTPADQAQMRELLSKLAEASGTPEPEERTDADLMYEAMLRWNGEPAGSAAVDRLIDSSKKESARMKRATQDKVRRMFWKDPFSDDPQKLVLVRQEDRDLLDQYQRRNRRSAARAPREPDTRETELMRLRRELAAARADADEARAESDRIRKRAESQQNSCVADESSGEEVRRHRRVSGNAFHSRSADRARSQQQIALATTAPAESYTPPPPPPVSMPTAAVPAHGIIITPLPSPTPPEAPPVEARRHGRSR